MLSYKTIIAKNIRHLMPPPIRNFLLQHPATFSARGEKWREENPYRNESQEWLAPGDSKYQFGIIKEFWHLHWPFIAACRDLNVSYKIIDISGPDWLDVLKKSGCDAFLCRPSVQYKTWKEMYDEKLRIFSAIDPRIIFPDPEALWIWESKRRMHYWLDAHNIPHPKSWVFYNKKYAIDFASQCNLPIIFKSNMGSGASGVIIFDNRGSLQRHITHCFSKGYSTYRRIRNDREFGSVFLQEYLQDVREWRTVRIGNSFFGYEKGSCNGLHSGSKRFFYGQPPDEVLHLTKKITDIGKFMSMNIDIFLTSDGRLFVNELQAIFGQSGSREICRVDNQTGRMIWDKHSEKWIFEPGTFCQNYLCNLRVETLIKLLDTRKNISATPQVTP
ncbi:RimK-like protein [Desulfocapsa sulfexigens DSM 10523]|uniref:RimK-like protein n=1 Tax=Desulfocapsa sulfexigens (strain DSM 10523 / SB164P1) TaxID=1167006 RepID=M1P4E3_DESSD|nr:RimK-like protein [Desulfocapsa sulfexigens]AGF78358.1 RimK-like protein [Desulfocapsa sulfexigens DSM 10523]